MASVARRERDLKEFPAARGDAQDRDVLTRALQVNEDRNLGAWRFRSPADLEIGMHVFAARS
jgi:hypothetical protein